MSKTRELIAMDVRQEGPSSPLSVPEIQGMIHRLRRAHIAASINDDPRWPLIADAIAAMQALHRHETNGQY
jgi:hypothetical protein